MSKKVLLNASVYRYYSNTFEITNLLLINNVLVGKGYVPDDDDAEEINLKGYWIIPDATLILPGPIPTLSILDNLPFTNIALPIETQTEIDDLGPYTIYPLLPKTKDISEGTDIHYRGLSSIKSDSSDNETVFQLSKNANKPFIISDLDDQLDSLIEHHHRIQFPLHICCSSIHTIKKLSATPSITFSIDIPLLSDPNTLRFLSSTSCRGFTLINHHQNHYLDLVYKELQPLDICKILSKSPLELLSEKPNQIKLNNKPFLKSINAKKGSISVITHATI